MTGTQRRLPVAPDVLAADVQAQAGLPDGRGVRPAGKFAWTLVAAIVGPVPVFATTIRYLAG